MLIVGELQPPSTARLEKLRPFGARSPHAIPVTEPTASRPAQPPEPFFPCPANYQERETEPRACRLEGCVYTTLVSRPRN